MWTIAELARAVELALAEGYEGPADARARELPDTRTIRYYTTLGLLDRPSEMQGRTALYGSKHLCQLVAIKRLQGEGRALSEIQQRLAGATSRRLAELARIDVDRIAKRLVRSATAETTPPARARFWAAAPAAPTIVAPERSAAALGVAVPLGDGVQLLLSAPRTLDADDVAALREAARAIHETLRRRGLTAAAHERRDP